MHHCVQTRLVRCVYCIEKIHSTYVLWRLEPGVTPACIRSTYVCMLEADATPFLPTYTYAMYAVYIHIVVVRTIAQFIRHLMSAVQLRSSEQCTVYIPSHQIY